MFKRIFKILFLSIALCTFCVTPIYAQTGKVASRIVEKIFKKSGRKVVKEGAEKAGKEAGVGAVGKAFGKKAAKRVGEDVTFSGIEKGAVRLEKKEVGSTLRKSAANALEITTDAGRVLLKKGTIHSIGHIESKAVASSAERLFINKGLAESGESAISKGLKQSAAQKAISNKTAKRTVSGNVEKQLEEEAAKMSAKGHVKYFEKLIKKKAPKFGMTDEQQQKLLKDIASNPDLADLIRKNPDFNIGRWLETMKPVDKSKLFLANGKYPINYQYAGKRFFFHPALNKNVDAQLLKKGSFNGYSREQLKELDKLFPKGVPFDELGFPDFVRAGLCKKGPNGKDIIVTLEKGFTGNREKDFELARKILKDQGIVVDEFGYIWHHLPGMPPRMALIKTEAHEIIKHTGGHSLAKAAL